MSIDVKNSIETTMCDCSQQFNGEIKMISACLENIVDILRRFCIVRRHVTRFFTLKILQCEWIVTQISWFIIFVFVVSLLSPARIEKWWQNTFRRKIRCLLSHTREPVECWKCHDVPFVGSFFHLIAFGRMCATIEEAQTETIRNKNQMPCVAYIVSLAIEKFSKNIHSNRWLVTSFVVVVARRPSSSVVG